MARTYAEARPDRVEKNVTFFDVFRFAAGYWRRQPVRLALVLFFYTAAVVTETYMPNALAMFLASVREHQDKAAVYFRLSIFLGAYLAQLALVAIGSLFYNFFENNIFKLVLDDAFAHVQRLSEYFFVNTFAGSIITKINRGRGRIEAFEDQILTKILPTIVMLTGSTFFLAQHFPLLALMMGCYIFLLMAVSAFMVMRVVGPSQGEAATAQDQFGALLADSISGIATTKSFAQERHELSNYRRMTSFLRGKTIRSYLYGNLAGLVQRLLLTGMLTLLLGGGTWYFFQGKASVENMAYLAFAYTIMQSYIRDLGDTIKNIMTSSYDLHAVVVLMREKPETADNSLPDLVITKGEIVFEDVTFTYPEKSQPVFSDLSVTIRAGERVALVGHSGSGKSSFIRLLQALYAVQKGRILIDGQNIAEGSRQSLRRAIALVPQDPGLFHRTLQDNIAYGRPEASFDEVRAAARQANIDDFIMTLPQQYNTLVGERGIKLSGGERQRIAIARALLADRPILVLDEATSSLDSASEHSIQDALLKLTRGRTSIMIAHRLSTIMDADRILVFDKGRVVEEGTHDQLILKEGIYAEFFRIQSGGFIEP